MFDVNNTGPHKHPLLNDVVLAKIFQYFGFDQLDTCRKVCSVWADVAETKWLKNCPVKEFRENQLEFYLDNDSDVWAKERLNKLRLLDFNFGERWDNAFSIWKTHGTIITFLEIKNCCIASINAFLGLLFCKATPSLQTLKLINTRFPFLGSLVEVFPDEETFPVISLQKLQIRYNKAYRFLPVHWGFIFQCFTHLQSLMLLNYATPYYGCELARVLDGITTFYDRNGNRHPLHSLILSDVSDTKRKWQMFPDSVLQYFQEDAKMAEERGFALHLDRLSICSEYPTDDAKCFELISYLQTDLTRLRIAGTHPISQPSLVASSTFSLPLLQQLCRLDLIDYPVVTFNFLFDCPNLKYCNIILLSGEARLSSFNAIRDTSAYANSSRDCSRVFQKNNQTLSSMSSFICNLKMNWNKSDLQQLATWMPNLRTLLLSVTNSSFGAIGEGFTRLQSLFLYDSYVSDASIAGISSNLNDLQILGFCDRPNDYQFPPTLTVKSVNNGLLQLPSLTKLFIPQRRMTPSGFDALKVGGYTFGLLQEELSIYPMTFHVLAVTKSDYTHIYREMTQ